MKLISKKLLVIGSIVISVVSFFTLFLTKSSSNLPGLDFMEKYNNTQNSLLIDVRMPSEFLAGHIPHAINIDFQSPTFISDIKKLNPSKTYFVYCRSGNRSHQAVTIMRANGIKNIYELQGGIISNKAQIELTQTP